MMLFPCPLELTYIFTQTWISFPGKRVLIVGNKASNKLLNILHSKTFSNFYIPCDNSVISYLTNILSLHDFNIDSKLFYEHNATKAVRRIQNIRDIVQIERMIFFKVIIPSYKTFSSTLAWRTVPNVWTWSCIRLRHLSLLPLSSKLGFSSLQSYVVIIFN